MLTALRIRAREATWDVAGATGIFVDNHDIFTAYYQISEADADAAFILRTDPRAVQNARAMMYRTLKQAQISAKEGGFHGSTNTLQEDVVAMFAKRANSKRPGKDKDNSSPATDKKPCKAPPLCETLSYVFCT